MQTREDRINGIIPILEELLAKPFPEHPDEPNDSYAWENHQKFLANAPDRLISIIAAEYCNCDEPDEDGNDLSSEELFSAAREKYRDIYRRAVAAVSTQWGEGRTVTKNDMDHFFLGIGKPTNPDLLTATPPILLNFDCVLFSSWDFEVTYWVKGSRVAAIHYVGENGDGDFQLAVSACVFPNQ